MFLKGLLFIAHNAVDVDEKWQYIKFIVLAESRRHTKR